MDIIYTKVSSDFTQSLQINNGTIHLYGSLNPSFTLLYFIAHSNSTNQRYITVTAISPGYRPHRVFKTQGRTPHRLHVIIHYIFYLMCKQTTYMEAMMS
jgi:hypothetical protein